MSIPFSLPQTLANSSLQPLITYGNFKIFRFKFKIRNFLDRIALYNFVYSKNKMIPNQMKRILALGVCALFIACNSSTEKTTDTDTSSVVVVDTTPVISNSDTSSVALSPAPETAPVQVSKSPEVKTAEKTPKTAETRAKAPEKAVQASDNSADTKKGEMLISKSDCFACHKIQDKLLGPAYKDVAIKYANTKANVDYLVTKIKNGGSGVWGAIPMSPHPALSDEDARAMVAYILSIK